MSGPEITSVAYKKGNLLRYTLWGLGATAVTLLAVMFVNMVNAEVSPAVPEGYRFAVTDNYAEGSRIRTTYYIYNNRILVEDESFSKSQANRTIMIYDNVNTTSLVYDKDDKTQICELGSCREQPKVLAVIKKLISRKVGREYIGL